MTTEKVTIMCSCGNGYETDVTHEFTKSDPPVHQENAKKSCPYCGVTYHIGHVMEKRLIRLKDNLVWEYGISDPTGCFKFQEWAPTDSTTTTFIVSANDWLWSSLTNTFPMQKDNPNWMLDGVIY